jgi:hypothetical protein
VRACLCPFSLFAFLAASLERTNVYDVRLNGEPYTEWADGSRRQPSVHIGVCGRKQLAATVHPVTVGTVATDSLSPPSNWMDGAYLLLRQADIPADAAAGSHRPYSEWLDGRIGSAYSRQVLTRRHHRVEAGEDQLSRVGVGARAADLPARGLTTAARGGLEQTARSGPPFPASAEGPPER